MDLNSDQRGGGGGGGGKGRMAALKSLTFVGVFGPKFTCQHCACKNAHLQHRFLLTSKVLLKEWATSEDGYMIRDKSSKQQ